MGDSREVFVIDVDW